MRNSYGIVFGVIMMIATQPVLAAERDFSIPQVSGTPVEDKGPLDGEFMIQMQTNQNTVDHQKNVLSDQTISDIARAKKITGNGGNTATVIQNGKENSSEITQEGDNNEVYVKQDGDHNVSEEKQEGNNNKKTVIQNGKKTVSPVIEQVGKEAQE